MAVNLERFHQTFFDEAVEHLAEMERSLLELESRPGDDGLLNAIFRGAHSIKGASGTFGFTDVSRFTHALENLLDRLRQRKLEPSAELVDLLLRATDCLRGLIETVRGHGTRPDDVDSVTSELQAVLGGTGSPAAVAIGASPAPVSPVGPRDVGLDLTPDPDILRHGADPILLLRELAALGEIRELQVDLSSLPSLDSLDPEICYLSWSVVLRTAAPRCEIDDVFCFVQDDIHVEVTDPLRLVATEDVSSSSSTNSVPLERAGALLSALSGLLQIQADISSRAAGHCDALFGPFSVPLS